MPNITHRKVLAPTTAHRAGVALSALVPDDLVILPNGLKAAWNGKTFVRPQTRVHVPELGGWDNAEVTWIGRTEAYAPKAPAKKVTTRKAPKAAPAKAKTTRKPAPDLTSVAKAMKAAGFTPAQVSKALKALI